MKKLTDYEKYIRTEELLSLQKTDAELCCDDELTFQMIHQIAELHFKLIIQYANLAKAAMLKKNVPGATAQFRRIGLHLKHLPEVFNMVKVISPKDYHIIRLSLGQGSGQDSPGFNHILKLGPTLWEPFAQLLKEKNLTVLDVHRNPELHNELFELLQEMISLDENFQTFRYNHVQLVRRMIGLQTKSLKGVPAQMLERGIKFEFFPELWKAICDLTDETGSSYNAKPLD